MSKVAIVSLCMASALVIYGAMAIDRYSDKPACATGYVYLRGVCVAWYLP